MSNKAIYDVLDGLIKNVGTRHGIDWNKTVDKGGEDAAAIALVYLQVRAAIPEILAECGPNA